MVMFIFQPISVALSMQAWVIFRAVSRESTVFFCCAMAGAEAAAKAAANARATVVRFMDGLL